MTESPELGRVLEGRYRLEALIGAGGMARVYQATHLGLTRRLAVKVLKPELGCDREAIERFQNEAFASGQLDHPNIVAVSDCGLLSDGAMFLAMEMLEGESLESRMSREHRFEWPVALQLMRELLAGLQYAHDREIVHCDIKPENIFLAVKHGLPSVKLLDFGIARLYSSLRTEPSETTVGTPAYMSPEQALGNSLTPSSDLYSASVVLYEMLCGHSPFAERTLRETLMAHLTKPVPRFPAELKIPASLEQLVLKGLAKAPDSRIATARAYQREIDAILDAAGYPVPGRARTNPPVAPTEYEVIQPLGSTELTDEFIARRGSERPIVMKRLRPLAVEPRIVDSFLAAARVAARVEDPRVARVIASGGTGTSTFVAVDYLPGETLETIASSELAIHLVVWIAHEAAAAVNAAHELVDAGGQPIGVVHGLITPASIVVRHTGEVVVTDFEASAARLLRNRLSSRPSPEELAGAPIDRRTDVFGLGVVLWEVIARKALFDQVDPVALAKLLRSGLPRVSSVVPDVPVELDHIVATALSTDPDLRYQTAEAMRVALSGFLHRSGFTGGPQALAEYLEALLPERVEAGRRWVEAVADRSCDELPLLAPLPGRIRRTVATTMMARKRRRPRWLVIGGIAAVLGVGGIVAAAQLATTEPAAGTTRGDATPERPDAGILVASTPDAAPTDPVLARVEVAIREGRLVAPKGDNALELLVQAEREHPSERTKDLRALAADTLHASARMLWDRGKLDSARMLYADILRFEPADLVALERTRAVKTARTAAGHRIAGTESVRRLVMEIDLAIIERRFVAPPGHNALEYLTQLRKIDPANAAARTLGTEVATALSKEAQVKPAEATKLLDAAEQARGDDADKPEEPNHKARVAELIAKARTSAAAGSFAAAAADYERAIALDSRSHAALGGLAEIAFNQGEFGRAVLSSKRAVAIAPRVVVYRMTLAKSYFKLLRYEDAMAQWQAVLDMDPSNATAKKNLELARNKR